MYQVVYSLIPIIGAAYYFFGLGAVKSVRLAHYSVSTKKYLEHKIKKPLEMVNITGIITKDKAHVHGIFGNQLFRGYGGHIVRAVVAAACEIILVETAEKITRRHSEEVGLELLDLGDNKSKVKMQKSK